MPEIEVPMPKLSMTMEEGELITWVKHEGDQVRAGDVIAEVNSDKVEMEVESPVDGTLVRLAAAEGEVVPVGAIATLETVADDLLGCLPDPGRRRCGPGGQAAPTAARPPPHRARPARAPPAAPPTGPAAARDHRAKGRRWADPGGAGGRRRAAAADRLVSPGVPTACGQTRAAGPSPAAPPPPWGRRARNLLPPARSGRGRREG